jgi:hypothetical protein
MFDEKLGKLVVLVKRGYQSGLFNPEKYAFGDRGGRHHPKRLACNASLSKDTSTIENPNDRRLPLLGGNSKLHPAFLDIEGSVGTFSLNEDIRSRPACDDFSLCSEIPEEAVNIKPRRVSL